MFLEETFTSSGDTSGKPECILASNRGPIEYYVEDGQYKMRLGAGGLVTALLGATQQHHVVWIALSMTKADRLGIQANQHLSSILPPIPAGITLRLLNI